MAWVENLSDIDREIDAKDHEPITKRKAETISVFQLMKQYSTQRIAIDCFEKIQWGNKPVCPKCSSDDKITPQKKYGDYWCSSCRSYFNIFINTPMFVNGCLHRIYC